MPQSIQDGALPWQRLAVINKHPRDDRIQFEEESHVYTVDGSKGFVSCTTFVHSFFGEFNPDVVIARMMKSPKWPNSEYFGMTPDEIKKQWNDSSTAGTRMHLDIEHLYNAMTTGYRLEDGLAGLKTDEWEPLHAPEWQYFCNFQQSHAEPKGLIPFRTEWLVFDEELKLSGSIDMVFKKPDGTFAIYDWKRSKEIRTQNNFQSGLGPLSHLPDVNYWHYSMQLNVYRYMLQKNYGITVSELALVILHPTNTSWRILQLNLMDDEVAGMMETRRSTPL